MIRAVILDLDGTVYTGRAAVPGAADFVAWLRAAGIRALFVTNRANRAPEDVCAHLEALGIPCAPADVLTSAQATARHVGRATVFCIGESGILRELEAAGAVLLGAGRDDLPEYVVVSFDRDFNYAKLQRAATLIHAGARFVATNPDPFLKTEHGTVPGTGAIVAAVATATGVRPVVIGKPERAIMDMALDVLGTAACETLVVGDNVQTDVPAGAAAGARTALVLTGVSTRAEAETAAVRPDWIVAGFDELRRAVEAEQGGGAEPGEGSAAP